MSSEFGEFCKDLREKEKCDYFNNLKTKGKISFSAQSAINELKKEPCHVEKLKRICNGKGVCPYETACLLAKDAQVIVADYYHFIHPHIRAGLLRRMGKNMEDCIIIMDEGHNLPGRARKLLTQSITTYAIEHAIKEAKATGYYDTANWLLELKNSIDNLSKTIPDKKHERLIGKDELLKIIKPIADYEDFAESLHSIADEIIETRKKSFASGIASFLESWTGPDKSFARIFARAYGKSLKPYLSITYKCLDPSIALKEMIENAYSVIVMSGTLTPVEMYRDLLGFSPDSMCAEYQSPFPKENRLSLVVPKTSTKFTVRNENMYAQIAKECAGIVNSVPGNCAVFFPSYHLRDDVYKSLRDLCTKTVFLEEAGMTKESKAEMLDSFKSFKDAGAVLLAASSGSFGEGIDLVGDFLNCVVVVGLPLTKPDLETDELIKYYDEKYGKGWDYGYVMPALITAMQNAGRCIRSGTDRGVIVFLDERYIWPRYFNCFPKDWNMKVTSTPKKEIDNFYGKFKETS